MNEYLNYAIVIIVAIIGTLAATYLVYRLGASKLGAGRGVSRMKCEISRESIEKCILPNNKGRSIDEVFDILDKEGIVPEFHIDLT